MTPPWMKTKRSVGLTVLLVVLAIVQAYGAYRGFYWFQKRYSHNQNGWELALVGASLSVAALIGLAGVWFWRRWGVYLVGALSVIGVASDAIFGIPSWQMLMRLALLAVFAFLIKKQWPAFR